MTNSARTSPSSPSTAARRCWPPGWPREAARETDTALSRLPPEGGIAYKKAELLFAAATAALAAGHPADARQRATQAHRLFRAQGRALWQARAALVLAEARYAAGEHSAALLRYAEEVAARLDASRSGEAMQAHLLAGRIALSRGSVARSRPAPRARREVPPPRPAAGPERGLAGPGPAGRRARQRPGHRRGLRARPRRPRGAPDEARGHRVARVRHGARRRARHAGPARRAQAWRRPPAAVLERAMAGDRAGRPEHTAPGRQGASGRARSAAQREPAPRGDRDGRLAPERPGARAAAARGGGPGPHAQAARQPQARGRRLRPRELFDELGGNNADRARHGRRRAARDHRRGPAGAPAHGGQHSRARGPDEPLRAAPPRPWPAGGPATSWC